MLTFICGNMKTLLSETAEYSYTPDEKVIAPGYKAVETNGFENKTIKAIVVPNGANQGRKFLP